LRCVTGSARRLDPRAAHILLKSPVLICPDPFDPSLLPSSFSLVSITSPFFAVRFSTLLCLHGHWGFFGVPLFEQNFLRSMALSECGLFECRVRLHATWFTEPAVRFIPPRGRCSSFFCTNVPLHHRPQFTIFFDNF